VSCRAGGRRRSKPSFLAALLLFALAAILSCSSRAIPERIVLIVIDTLRRDHLSVYGAEVNTPNIEQLARRGTIVPNALSSFHQTTMSMGALFTGRTPSLEIGDSQRTVSWVQPNWCGLARFISEDAGDSCIPSSLPTLAEGLREHGYWTAGVVANNFLFSPAGFDRGFAEWREIGALPKGKLWLNLQLITERRSGRHVNEAVREVLAERPSDHFFLYVHYMDVHDWPQKPRGYTGAVEIVDGLVGGVLAELEGLGLMENTLVVLTSDHGEALDESHLLLTTPTHFGNPSFEQVLQIPLIVVGGPIESETPIRSQDLYHWLGRQAGLPDSSAPELEPGELYVTEHFYRTYRKGRWKSFWRRHDGDFRLVDLAVDPAETLDVADRHPEVATAHRARMDALTAELAAPEAVARDLTPGEVGLLRALGYLGLPEDDPHRSENRVGPEASGITEGQEHRDSWKLFKRRRPADPSGDRTEEREAE
jgi:arylsulfatase A-like enzyme